MSGTATAKGLRGGALGIVSSVVIGVASTAPAYSIAASLGVVAASVGTRSPAVMLVAFVPMLLIAGAYHALNRLDPDCGTTFAWVTRAFGPIPGWIAGWALLAADILVMASLSQIAGKYTLLLFGADALAESAPWVTALGVLWIIFMTWICYVGIEVSARAQWVLLGIELATLAAFTVVALVRVFEGTLPHSVQPGWTWLDPAAIPSASALTAGMLAAVFMFWGWDTAVAVNEETADPRRTPGLAAIVSTLLLLAAYIAVSIAAISVRGPDFLAKNQDDVLAPLGVEVLPWGLAKLLIVAVLTSAAASTQTTILPATRAALSMAVQGAAPASFGRIHPRYLTPAYGTIWMGAVSILCFLAFSFSSQDVLADSVTATGLMIAFYLGITGFACIWFFRRELVSNWRMMLLAGAGPCLGGFIFGFILVRSILDQLKGPRIGLPLLMTLLTLLVGFVLLALQWRDKPSFFRTRPAIAPRGTRL
jgi:amino acid transporter